MDTSADNETIHRAERRLSRLPRWSAVLEHGALLVILGLAGYLRLSNLEYAQFRFDDAILLQMARLAFRAHSIVTQGLGSSLGIPNGPFQVYIVMLPMIVTSHPLAPYLVVGSLNVAGVYFCWRFCKSFLGSRVALIATLILAVNPWSVIYSRRLWGDDMMAPFTILLIWALCSLVAKGRRRDSFFPILWLVILVQVYVVALVHVFTLIAGVILGWRRLRPGPLLAGVMVGLVLVLPYVLGGILPNLGSLERLNQISGRETVIDLESFRFALRVVDNQGYQAYANHAGRVWDVSTGLPKLVSGLEAVLLVLGIAVALFRAIKYLRQRNPAGSAPYVLGLIAVLLPPLLLVRHALPIYPYYVLSGFPMQFVLIGLAIDWLLAQRKWLNARPVLLWSNRVAVAGILTIIVVLQLAIAQVFFSVIHEYWPESDYGQPLTYAVSQARITEELRSQHDIERLYVLGANDPEVTVSHLLWSNGVEALTYDSNNMLVVPRADAGKMLYMLADDDSFGARPIVERFAGDEVTSLTIPGAGVTFRWFVLDGAATDTLLPPTSSKVGATYDGVARLDGYSLSAPGDNAGSRTLVTSWTLLRDSGPQLPQTYLYLRLIDNQRRVYYSLNRQFYNASNWRIGDRISTAMDFSTADFPPGRYWLLTGLFTMPTANSYQDMAATDSAGRALAEGVRLGPLYVRPSTVPEPTHKLGTSFDDKVSLDGYDLRTETHGDRRQLQVTLHWRAQARLDTNYSVFVHLLDADGRVVAQHDGPPDDDRYPTTAWLAGDVTVDLHRLPLPNALAPGRYTIATGLYDLTSGVRFGGPSHAARFHVDLP